MMQNKDTITSKEDLSAAEILANAAENASPLSKNEEILPEEIADELANQAETEIVLSKEEQLEKDLAESEKKYLLLYADFENFRKRTNKERIDLMLSAGKEVIKSVLIVLDDFERAFKNSDQDAVTLTEDIDLFGKKLIKSVEQQGLTAKFIKEIVLDDLEKILEKSNKNAAAFKKGIDLVAKKLSETLEKQGLKAMDCHEKKFDSEFHEAILQIPAPNPELVGKVTDVMEKGYLLHEKVLRHAKVVVGKASDQESAEQGA